jgi:hypothetical protein
MNALIGFLDALKSGIFSLFLLPVAQVQRVLKLTKYLIACANQGNIS